MKKISILILLIFISCSSKKEDYKKEICALRNKASKGYNTKYGILIDYSKSSGLKRGFIINLNKNIIMHSFLVMNGEGFSNKIGSNKTSLGFTYTHRRGHSNYGNSIKYTLIGTSSSNFNTYKRNIVLHSYKGFLNIEIYPLPIIKSKGCPTIPITSFEKIDSLIKRQKNKKILIYSFKK